MPWTAGPTIRSLGWATAENRGAGGLITLQLRLVALTLLLLPFNWLLGTALLWVYAVAAILLLSLQRLSLLEGVYGFLSAVLVFALVIAMANEGGIPADRILASIYNLTIVRRAVWCGSLFRRTAIMISIPTSSSQRRSAPAWIAAKSPTSRTRSAPSVA